jgi:hypothetical protein
MKQKTTYKINQVEDAIFQIVKLRLVENWTGCLKLESDGKEIIISQFPGGNSWTDGYETLYQISESDDWSDFGEFDDDFMKLSREQRWSEIDERSLLEYQISQTEERLAEMQTSVTN